MSGTLAVSGLAGTRGGLPMPPLTKPTEEPLSCAKCGRTTPHFAKDKLRICKDCGSKKYPQIWNKEMSMEGKIMEALGLICEEGDKPIEFKHEGLKKKTADGAHRFDKPVEYTQMQYDDRFWYKSKPKELR